MYPKNKPKIKSTTRINNSYWKWIIVHIKLVKVIAPQPPNTVLESCEYKKPLNKNSSANGAIITTEIKPKMIGKV